jgi:hypothetical protein
MGNGVFMRNRILGLLIFLLSSYSAAGAVSSGGGAPPVSHYPDDFKYSCHIRIDRVESVMNARAEATIEADYVIDHTSGVFNGVIPLKDLSWQTVKSNSALKIQPEDHSLYLSFEKTDRDFTAILRLQVTQNSESGQYELNTYRTTKSDFQSKQSLQIEGNIEERAKWINNQRPKGLSMGATSVSANCERIR